MSYLSITPLTQDLEQPENHTRSTLLIAETALNAIILDNKDKLTLICKF